MSESNHLINTIRVPRNLGQITERLPAANYEQIVNSNDRNMSLPPTINQVMSDYNRPNDSFMTNIPGSSYSKRGSSFAPISEREELIHSADPNYSKSKMYNALK